MESRSVDVSNFISPADVHDLIRNVDKYLETEGWIEKPGVPKFQTKSTLFEEPWAQKFRDSFIYACNQVITSFPKHSSVIGWCYKTNRETWDEVGPEQLWHEHGDCISGVFYLHLPNGTSGTQFKDPPVRDIEPKYLNWHLFPGNWVHRPKIPNSPEWRYVLGADLTDLSVWPFSPEGNLRKGR